MNGMNGLSGMNAYINNIQMQNAQSVTQGNMASLKGEKELKKAGVQDEANEPNDAVSLSLVGEPTTEMEMTAAENSGDLAQVDPQLKNKDQDRVESGRQQALHLAEEERSGGQLSEMGEGGLEADAMHTRVDAGDRGPRRTEEEIIQELMAGMPDDIKKVSGEMVTNQIRGTQPAPALARLHNLPEPAVKELGAAPLMSDIMEIHETGNLPMALHLEEAVQ